MGTRTFGQYHGIEIKRLGLGKGEPGYVQIWEKKTGQQDVDPKTDNSFGKPRNLH